MTDDPGVTDAAYTDLFRRYLDGASDAQSFRRDFYALMQCDARIGDTVRYAILQRVFFAGEDLVLDADLLVGEGRDDDEIDEPTFRRRIAAAARDLVRRPDDWESQHRA
ncbi:hypothetical protein GCM10027055_01070 [Janibacter alkaliphilus]|uniref:Colicin D immunity protein domain-containing protein n=1 Tax=Janibacter alkaliphilus TaxID=1069963 RepID=A0A852X089_9MICO|nr:hypothetical protein [Janibacter alkaliphilus]NYG36722.1 hypothetical protein [Janibacter alkaliphilus]